MNASTIDQSEGRARRMRAMIHRLDVDTLELAYAGLGNVYNEAASTCLNCGDTAQCLQWLAAAPAADERPAFCPNLALFERFNRQ